MPSLYAGRPDHDKKSTSSGQRYLRPGSVRTQRRRARSALLVV
jgi:uncharacterized Zn finger protein